MKQQIKFLQKEKEIVIPKASSWIIVDTNPRDREIIVESNASLCFVSCTITEIIGNTCIRLVGDGAQVEFTHLVRGTGTKKISLTSACLHEAKNTQSKTVVRSLVEESAQVKYDGLVKVFPQASGCKGYLQENTLLLGNEATAEIIPNLEIENNDVQCSHGATIGKIDPEQIFYLTSRGLPFKEAKSLIISGFFEEVISQYPNEVQEKVRGTLYG